MRRGRAKQHKEEPNSIPTYVPESYQQGHPDCGGVRALCALLEPDGPVQPSGVRRLLLFSTHFALAPAEKYLQRHRSTTAQPPAPSPTTAWTRRRRLRRQQRIGDGDSALSPSRPANQAPAEGADVQCALLARPGEPAPPKVTECHLSPWGARGPSGGSHVHPCMAPQTGQLAELGSPIPVLAPSRSGCHRETVFAESLTCPPVGHRPCLRVPAAPRRGRG